jgi:ElaB/YqjD/DUF883 family membrane-anchored ribosome-binding protein
MGQRPHNPNKISAVATEVDSLRERTQTVFAELEQRVRAGVDRVREVVDRSQHVFQRIQQITALVRKYPAVAIGLGSTVTIVLGLGVYVVVARRAGMRRPMNRFRSRLGAYRTLFADPRRAQHSRERLGRRLLRAVLVAGAVTATRGFVVIFVHSVVQPRLARPMASERLRLSAAAPRGGSDIPPRALRERQAD